MKRVCVIGNSHAGSLRLAAQKYWSNPNFAFAFYAIPGRMQPQLSREASGRLKAVKPQALRTDMEDAVADGLDVSRFDAVLISAIGLPNLLEPYHNLPHPLAAARCLNWPELDAGGRMPVSEAVMQETIASGLRRLHAYASLSPILEAFSGRVLVQPKPRPAQAMFSTVSSELFRAYGNKAPQVYTQVSIMQDNALAKIIETLSPRLHLLPHPEIEGGTSYSVPDSFNVTPDDVWHKGGLHGLEVLNLAAAELQ